ncbi:MAG TPA: GGDEF domain-containing protein [Baekduia sp.]|nr:GGDEF domain-containing protein [Baekduia sp.]
MRIVVLTTPGGPVLEAAGGDHTVRATPSADGARALIRRRHPDVLVVYGRADAALDLAREVRCDPDLLGTGVIALLDDPAAVAGWADVADDVLLTATAHAEHLPRLRTVARLAALRRELHARTEALEQLAYTDVLTALPNRRYLEGRLHALVSSGRRHERPLAVLLVDVDHFKAVNDLHGHDAGDRLLISAAHGMRRRLRTEDVLGRWAGDEFLAILPDTEVEAAARIAERLRDGVSRDMRRAAPGVLTGLSIGLVAWEGEDAATLVRRADDALYEAKRSGRGQVALGAAG